MFQSREVRHDDFEIIAAFPQTQEEVFFMFPRGVYPLTPEQLEEAARTRFSPTVVLLEGEVAGYCNFYQVQEGQDCWLGNLIVNPRLRNKGVGACLINEMKIKAVRDFGARVLRLVCHNPNTGALLFYYKLGFRPFDMNVMGGYGGKPIVGIKMALKLDEGHKGEEAAAR